MFPQVFGNIFPSKRGKQNAIFLNIHFPISEGCRDPVNFETPPTYFASTQFHATAAALALHHTWGNKTGDHEREHATTTQ